MERADPWMPMQPPTAPAKPKPKPKPKPLPKAFPKAVAKAAPKPGPRRRAARAKPTDRSLRLCVNLDLNPEPDLDPKPKLDPYPTPDLSLNHTFESHPRETDSQVQARRAKPAGPPSPRSC